MTTVLLANPAAGRGRGAVVATAALAAARAYWPEAELLLTESPGGAAAQAATAARAGATRLVVIGGDGTVHEVANGLLAAGASCPIGVIPVGTGNDFARQLRTARLRPAEAVRALAGASVCQFDVIRVGEEWVINSCGVGFAADTAVRANAYRRLRGSLAYAAAVARTLLALEPLALEVHWLDGGFEGEVLLLEVGNGNTTGGGFRLVPDARPDDGALDYCLIRSLGLGGALLRLPGILVARHGRDDRVTLGRATRLSVRALGRPVLTMHLDGEVRRLDPPEVTLMLEPARLPVLVANGAAG